MSDEVLVSSNLNQRSAGHVYVSFPSRNVRDTASCRDTRLSQRLELALLMYRMPSGNAHPWTRDNALPHSMYFTLMPHPWAVSGSLSILSRHCLLVPERVSPVSPSR